MVGDCGRLLLVYPSKRDTMVDACYDRGAPTIVIFF